MGAIIVAIIAYFTFPIIWKILSVNIFLKIFLLPPVIYGYIVLWAYIEGQISK